MQEVKEWIDISIDLSKIHPDIDTLKINEYLCKFMNTIIWALAKSMVFVQYM